MILDAGVFIALDNPSRARVVNGFLDAMRADGEELITNDVVLAQAWRNPAKQVRLTRLVAVTTVYPFGDAQTVGQKCRQSRTSDVVDASLAVLADQLSDTVLTSDPADMGRLGVKHLDLSKVR